MNVTGAALAATRAAGEHPPGVTEAASEVGALSPSQAAAPVTLSRECGSIHSILAELSARAEVEVRHQ